LTTLSDAAELQWQPPNWLSSHTLPTSVHTRGAPVLSMNEQLPAVLLAQ